jgi:lipoprotein NlpI
MISNKMQLVIGAIAVIGLLGGLGYGVLAITQQSRNWDACARDIHADALDADIASCDAVVQSVVLTTAQRATALDNRSNAYSEKGDLDRALADDDEAIRLDPMRATAFNSRGFVFQKKGDYDKAIVDFDTAVELNPRFGSALANRGRAYQAKGDLRRAVADFARAVSGQPTNPYPVLWLYLARARSGDATTAAAELFANAERLKASQWPYAVVEFYLGQRSGAAMLAAPTKPEERCEAQFYLGEWKLLQADRAAAIEALTTAAQTCPKNFTEFTDAKVELKRLGQ